MLFAIFPFLFILSFSNLKMPFSSSNVTSRRSSIKSAFGSPQKWKNDSLPTNLDVGKHFLYKQAEMMAKTNCSRDVSNLIVAKEVFLIIISTFREISGEFHDQEDNGDKY
jgi:hypothetical protein